MKTSPSCAGLALLLCSLAGLSPVAAQGKPPRTDNASAASDAASANVDTSTPDAEPAVPAAPPTTFQPIKPRVGYFPTPVEPLKPTQAAATATPEAPQNAWNTLRPFHVGLFMSIGGRGRPETNSSPLVADNEFRGQFDVRGGLFFDIYQHVRIDVGLRTGTGGINIDLYQDRYELPTLSSSVFGVDGGLRIFPIFVGSLAPYFGATMGYASAKAELHEPTGVTICEDTGTSIRCEDETRVTFQTGWEGRSYAAVAGVRFANYPVMPIEFGLEFSHTWTTWMRYNLDGEERFSARQELRPRTRQWGGSLLVGVRF